MKPPIRAAVIVFILAILASLAGRALPDGAAEVFSRTCRFTIDGRTFTVEDPAVAGPSLVDRELARMGIKPLPAPAAQSSGFEPPPVEALDEGPLEKGDPELPRGLEPNHVMRMETATGPVEIAVGRVLCRQQQIIGRLRSAGWTCSEAAGTGAIAHVTNGKEASVVVVETNERRFLAIRRALR